MKQTTTRILLPLILTLIGTSYGGSSGDTNQVISQRIAADLRESMNPFAPEQKVRFVRIHLEKSATDIDYSINDRPMTMEALDTTLGKFAQIDRSQTLVVELGPGVSPDDLAALIALLKKH